MSAFADDAIAPEMILNKISMDNNTIHDINPNIIAPIIYKVIQFLLVNVLDGSYKLTIHSINNESLVLVFTTELATENNTKIVDDIIATMNCVCVIVNGNIIFGSPEIEDHILDHTIKRHYDTFRQTNDVVRAVIYGKMLEIVKPCNNMVFIGGECYVYAKILRDIYNSCIVVSDYDDIVHYANINLTDIAKSVTIKKVSYESRFIELLYEDVDYMIFNVRSLLASHINTITRYQPKNVVVISCRDSNIKKMEKVTGYDMVIIVISNIKLLVYTKRI